MTNNEQNESGSEFQAFESLAKKLMKVPQHELKEKIEEEKNKKDDRVQDEENPDRPSEES